MGLILLDMQRGVLQRRCHALLVIDLPVQRLLRVMRSGRDEDPRLQPQRQATVQLHPNTQTNHSRLSFPQFSLLILRAVWNSGREEHGDLVQLIVHRDVRELRWHPVQNGT